MTQRLSPLARAGLLLFSVAVVGALIGFAWEGEVHEREEARLEALMTSATQELNASSRAPSSAQASSGISEAERNIIQRATQGLPPYKGAVPQALAADFLGPNAPMAAAWFMTEDSPQEVLGFYQGSLLDAGLPIYFHNYNENAGYVGYMEPHTKVMHTVSVLVQGQQTAVFVSKGKVADLLDNPVPMPAGLSLPPGAGEPMVLSFREEGRVRYVITADLEPEKVNALNAFYRGALEPQGWVMDEPEPGSNQVSFRRGSSRFDAAVQREGAAARLYLTLEQQE
ncbi:hypothetical protein [Stigmatella aurantiaca]|uniref:Conserved uncharacterized protein n=2 Tax=Stigmatella aurantiaca (strain DW4/3-1) TaxID=378806 RepID=E3FZE7_STIAD|nr:hypothetical protein [Stigmatella aurantiaca]ADO76148.1 conserved uncharacterized protein [Stigmatella aurantiaca DW4/3-1]